MMPLYLADEGEDYFKDSRRNVRKYCKNLNKLENITWRQARGYNMWPQATYDYTNWTSKDTNRKIRTTFFIDNCVWILDPNSLQDMHSAFWARLTLPQTSSVFSVLLLEPFLEPHMYMNSIFLIFLLVSLRTRCK